jgi:hypothetical protein
LGIYAMKFRKKPCKKPWMVPRCMWICEGSEANLNNGMVKYNAYNDKKSNNKKSNRQERRRS